jgi:hypothetical protein
LHGRIKIQSTVSEKKVRNLRFHHKLPAIFSIREFVESQTCLDCKIYTTSNIDKFTGAQQNEREKPNTEETLKTVVRFCNLFY